MQIPPLKRTSVEQAIKALRPSLAQIILGPHRSTKYDLVHEGLFYPPKVVIAKALEIEHGREFSTKGFSGGESAANAVLRALKYTVVKKSGPSGKLPLVLHNRCGRKDAYACFGIKYDQQMRHLNVGLSPQLPDKGYFIFVTLDKEGFDPLHDYEDEMFADRFIWITRRSVTEDDEDYVNLRQSECRVSLFVRNRAGEQFLYAGELGYDGHTPFVDAKTGKPQLKMVWVVKHPIPDELLQELSFGLSPHTGKSPKEPLPKSSGSGNGRAPASFDEFKKAYTYALGAATDRVVVPEHHNYQVRLKKFLASRKVVADMERDFIDVAFELDEPHIGEIKVTRNLNIAQAFRTALGQVIEYRHLRCTNNPRMILFFDQPLDPGRLKIATTYNIAVVVSTGEEFVLLNPEVCTMELTTVFGKSLG